MRQPVYLPQMGIVSPLGQGKAATAAALFAGSTAGLVRRDDLIPGESAVVGAVTGLTAGGHRSPTHHMLALAFGQIAEAVTAARARFGARRLAVVLGTSTSGLASVEAALRDRDRQGRWPEGFDWHTEELGNVAEDLADLAGITGPCFTVSTACSSSAKAMASARRLILSGHADAVLVGGADSLTRMTVAGFRALELTAPDRCRPFSANRDGINVGEGAALFLMTAEPAPVRLAGAGETTDAYHISAPDPEGHGGTAAMHAALAEAGLEPAALAYINLHGTGTALNDAMEAGIVSALAGTAVPCSSTKGMTGHTLGAAGAIEAAFLWLCLSGAEDRLPPHAWDGVPDPALPPLSFVTQGQRRKSGPAAMLSNSFAFGGSNCALVLAGG